MTTKTTFHLSMPRWRLSVAHVRAWLHQHDPLVLLAVPTLLVIVGLILARQITSAPAQAAIPPAPIFIVQTAQAQAMPTSANRAAAVLPTATPHLVVAFDSPNGIAFPDPIPEPPPATWIARWGDGWIEVQWSPNPIWIRSADIGANLADVRPVPSIVIAPAAPQPAVAPAAAEQEYQVANEQPILPLPADMRDQTEAQRAWYRASIGLTDADMDRALAEHQAQQAASCDRDNDYGEYCTLVRAAIHN